MTIDEAIRILDPTTTLKALAEHEYYGGFSGKEAQSEACNEACRVACAALRKAARYEQLERDGRLLRLPCKVGDTVYSNILWSGDYERAKDKPYPHRVAFIGINGEKDFFNTVNIRTGRMFSFGFENIGKTVFLTRAEAEAALEKGRQE